MSLYKVLQGATKTSLVQQEVKAASGGSFVWGKEGFKWIQEAVHGDKTNIASEHIMNESSETRDNTSSNFNDDNSVNFGDKAYK